MVWVLIHEWRDEIPSRIPWASSPWPSFPAPLVLFFGAFPPAFAPFYTIWVFEILKREKIIKNENKTCKDMYIWYVTQFIYRHMRQEDNGPNLFTLLKEDIFKDDLHLEGVLMEYILLCLRLRREDFYVCICNSFQRKCSPV